MTTPHPTPEERYEAAVNVATKNWLDHCQLCEHENQQNVESLLHMLQIESVAAIREAEAAGEARGRAIAIVAVEQVAASQGRTECCGCGISLGGPPECCNDPLYMISDRDAIAAIRAHTDKESSDD